MEESIEKLIALFHFTKKLRLDGRNAIRINGLFWELASPRHHSYASVYAD